MTPPLTYTANIQPNGDVTIVLGEFTHERDAGRLFEATNGVSVWTRVSPEWYQRKGELYLQGCVHLSDSDEITIPAADWPRVKQALDEYGAVRTNAEQAKESGMYTVKDCIKYFCIAKHGDEYATVLHKQTGCTRADADELCAKLTARAEAERKATEVRVEDYETSLRIYIGDRKSCHNCVTIDVHDDFGLTKPQADQLAAATADALRKILRGEGAK